MRSEQEIIALKEELERLTSFISKHGSPGPFGARDHQLGCDVCDAGAWVLGKISTDQFRGSAHINIERLYEQVRSIEATTGEKLTDYE